MQVKMQVHGNFGFGYDNNSLQKERNFQSTCTYDQIQYCQSCDSCQVSGSPRITLSCDECGKCRNQDKAQIDETVTKCLDKAKERAEEAREQARAEEDAKATPETLPSSEDWKKYQLQKKIGTTARAIHQLEQDLKGSECGLGYTRGKGGKACTNTNGNIDCINDNIGYDTVAEAKIQCNKMFACGDITNFQNKYYLRKKSDPLVTNDHAYKHHCTRNYVAHLPDYAKQPEISVMPPSEHNSNYNSNCEKNGYTQWDDGVGYDCQSHECLANNKGFTSLTEAMQACNTLQRSYSYANNECKYVVQDNTKDHYTYGHGKYYLRSERDETRKGQNKQKRTKRKCTAAEMVQPTARTAPELCKDRCSTCDQTEKIIACHVCALCKEVGLEGLATCGEKYKEWKYVATEEFTPQNSMIDKTGHHYAYNRLSDAIAQCDNLNICGGILKNDGKYYLRKTGIAEPKQGPNNVKYCGKKVQQPVIDIQSFYAKDQPVQGSVQPEVALPSQAVQVPATDTATAPTHAASGSGSGSGSGSDSGSGSASGSASGSGTGSDRGVRLVDFGSGSGSGSGSGESDQWIDGVNNSLILALGAILLLFLLLL
jgi:uncharacterized membrane protein YgcG